jgi:hypothetical protein
MQIDRRNGTMLCRGDHPWQSACEDYQIGLLAPCNAADSVSHFGSTGASNGSEGVCFSNGVVRGNGCLAFGDVFPLRNLSPDILTLCS